MNKKQILNVGKNVKNAIWNLDGKKKNIINGKEEICGFNKGSKYSVYANVELFIPDFSTKKNLNKIYIETLNSYVIHNKDLQIIINIMETFGFKLINITPMLDINNKPNTLFLFMYV